MGIPPSVCHISGCGYGLYLSNLWMWIWIIPIESLDMDCCIALLGAVCIYCEFILVCSDYAVIESFIQNECLPVVFSPIPGFISLCTICHATLVLLFIPLIDTNSFLNYNKESLYIHELFLFASNELDLVMLLQGYNRSNGLFGIYSFNKRH